MAAIIPHLEQQEDPSSTPEERRFLSKPEQRPLGDVDPLDFTGFAEGVINKSHAELIQLAWLRRVVTESLMGIRYHVQARDRHGNEPKKVFIVLDRPIEMPNTFVAPWNPPSTPESQQFSVLSWTSKMGAPSFSIPAGAIEAGGACPGAAGGQTIVPVEALRAGASRVTKVIGKPVRLHHAICNFCYATGGQYSTSGVQFAQVMRYIWARQGVKDGTFVKAMLYAIEHADYVLDGGKVQKITYPAERHTGRFFRIHDSGDFFDEDYLAAWKELANAFPDITFWAPSRIWATSWGVAAVNRINAEPRNLIIRPSAYHINEEPPKDLGPGWARGTTVYHKSLKVQGQGFDWDCQAYAVEDTKKTCRHAMAPDGSVGCRACWSRSDLVVNYTLH